MSKPILCLDFDGVIHSYSSGRKGAGCIPDPPVPGALTFIVEAIEHFDVQIFSSRSRYFKGRRAIKKWLEFELNNFCDNEWLTIPTVFKEYLTGFYAVHSDTEVQNAIHHLVYRLIKYPTKKPPAMVTIDDRAIRFTGEWPDVAMLKSFQPWNKKMHIGFEEWEYAVCEALGWLDSDGPLEGYSVERAKKILIDLLRVEISND